MKESLRIKWAVLFFFLFSPLFISYKGKYISFAVLKNYGAKCIVILQDENEAEVCSIADEVRKKGTCCQER